MHNEVTRRALLGSVAAIAAVAVFATFPPRQARALDVDQARVLVAALVEEINQIINSGGSEQQMFPRFERLFNDYADVPIIAQSALGVAARGASQSEMQAFTAAFRTYITRKYGRRFREFIGGRIEVIDARPVKSFYEVVSTAYLSASAPFEVRWHVSDRSGRDLFFNIIIEGVNMVATERTEIGAMLDRRGGDIGGLVQDLNAIG